MEFGGICDNLRCFAASLTDRCGAKGKPGVGCQGHWTLDTPGRCYGKLGARDTRRSHGTLDTGNSQDTHWLREVSSGTVVKDH